MSRSILFQRRFGPLFLTQFFSAFSDNFLKNSLVFLILFKMAGPDGEALVTLAGAVFIAPFFFLSGLGGEMADRYDKAFMAQRLKLIEMLVALVAVAGFAFHSIPVLFAALFGFGVMSALFGPIKYGILPDHLETSELTRGNALIEGATFIAILLGTVAGGLAARDGGDPASFGLALIAISALCWVSSLFIPKTGEGAPDLVVDRNVARSTGALLKDLWADTLLWRMGIIVSIFWLVGAVALSLLPPLVKNTLGGDELVVSLYLSVFAIAVAIGSGLGSFLSGGRIVLLPVPVAAVAMALFCLDLAWGLSGVPAHAAKLTMGEVFAQPLAWRLGIDLGGLALFGGVYVVPSFAAAQHWAPEDKRARIVAAINVVTAAFMVVGGVAFGALQSAGWSMSGLFALLGLLTLASAVWIFKVIPGNPLKDFILIVLRVFYRLEVTGKDNIAAAGPNAIIALNHVSFLDAAVAIAILDREPVFAIDHGISQRWWVRPFLKLTRAMPLDPTRPMATRSLIAAVKSGETLVIFPEGRLTVTGSLMKVYDGAGLIAEKAGVKVVPVRLEGLEATMFSRLTPGQVRKRWFPKVTVTVLEPVDLTVAPHLKGKLRRQAAGAALYEIMSDLVFRTTKIDLTVFQAVVDAARIHGASREAVQDPVTGALSYRRLLVGARVIGRKIAAMTEVGEAVGVLLPNANGAVVTLLGLISGARVPAMLNFTAGPANLQSACRTALVKTVITSRAFVEKGRLDGLVKAIGEVARIVYLEDMRGTVGWGDKLDGFLNWRKPIAAADASARVAILFTSGSEGAPKGVVLSHRNMLANAAQAAARIDFGRQDRVFNVLPVFHSFGLTAGTVLPLISGVKLFLYPSPLHYRIVPELVYGTNSTILFGTDTFLAGYARAAHAYDFRSLRYIVAGAEPVKAATRAVYLEKFGLRILEGYGVTETAPVLALNTPMFNRSGTVGRMLPGIEVRLEPVPGIEGGGRLTVRGPNVMLGYLKADNPGVLEPLVDGWHDTGDIVAIDDQGFVAIKGRAKRFAKIGGEMVSLAAVETLAAECWPDALSAVAAMPDPRKGERLVMVTAHKGATRTHFQLFAKTKGATELMIPAEVIVVDAVPVLGSGKLDFAGVAKLVRERASAPAEPKTEDPAV